MSVQVSYKKQFLLGIILLLLLIFSIELILKSYENFNPPCHYLGYDAFGDMESNLQKQICLDSKTLNVFYDPILQYVPNQHSSTININSHGFRGDDFQIQKQSNEIRIFILGGSTAFGYGTTSDKTTLAGFLEKKILAENPDLNISVINAGIAAASSSQEQYLIIHKILPLNPDLIIIYDGWNDSRFFHIPPQEMVKKEVNLKNILINIVLNSHQYRTPFVISEILGAGWDPQKSYDRKISENNDFTNANVENWKNNWIKICELETIHDFKTLITVQPIIGTSDKIYSTDELLFIPNSEYEKGVINMMNKLSISLNDLNNSCSDVLDLTNVFNGISEPIFYDRGHMTDRGYDIISDEMLDKVLKIINEIKIRNN
jgi:lysophospholipase L1-like esterase